MRKVFVLGILGIMAMLLFSVAIAVTAVTEEQTDNDNDCDSRWFCNQELILDCKEFYNDSHYYTIAKWSYDGNSYKVDEQNNLYRYYEINVNGNSKNADWTSYPKIKSVLVRGENKTTEFIGDFAGSINSTNSINKIIFCGYKNSKRGVNNLVSGPDGQEEILSSNSLDSGVPEYPTLTIGAAVLVATLGLVFMRKN